MSKTVQVGNHKLTFDEVVVIAKGMAWSWIYYAPRAAKKFVDEFGPFPGKTVEESVEFQTRNLREGIFAAGVNIDEAHERGMAVLTSNGMKPEPFPWMIENYRKRGIIEPGKEFGER